jgi:hypothetical protein
MDYLLAGAIINPSQHTRREKMTKLFSIICVLLLSACSAGEKPDAQSAKDWPQGTKIYVAPGANYKYVIPIKMDDGTRCILVANNSSGGGAISCDWK